MPCAHLRGKKPQEIEAYKEPLSDSEDAKCPSCFKDSLNTKFRMSPVKSKTSYLLSMTMRMRGGTAAPPKPEAVKIPDPTVPIPPQRTLSARGRPFRFNEEDAHMRELVELLGNVPHPLYLYGLRDETAGQNWAMPNHRALEQFDNAEEWVGRIREVSERRPAVGLSLSGRAQMLDTNNPNGRMMRETLLRVGSTPPARRTPIAEQPVEQGRCTGHAGLVDAIGPVNNPCDLEISDTLGCDFTYSPDIAMRIPNPDSGRVNVRLSPNTITVNSREITDPSTLRRVRDTLNNSVRSRLAGNLDESSLARAYIDHLGDLTIPVFISILNGQAGNFYKINTNLGRVVPGSVRDGASEVVDLNRTRWVVYFPETGVMPSTIQALKNFLTQPRAFPPAPAAPALFPIASLDNPTLAFTIGDIPIEGVVLVERDTSIAPGSVFTVNQGLWNVLSQDARSWIGRVTDPDPTRKIIYYKGLSASSLASELGDYLRR